MKKAFTVLSLAWASLLVPSLAWADTGIGDAAATEITLLIPQTTIVGLAVIALIGVIVAIYLVIRMMKSI